jgi:HEPN domain-containing protein
MGAYMVSSTKSDRTRISVNLIRISQRDFEAATALFERGLYSQAIFMLQQSLEKAVKAVLLKIGIVDPEEVKKRIGHSVAKKTLEMLANELPKRIVMILATISKRMKGEFEEIRRELLLDIIEVAALSYEEFLREKDELFKAMNEMGRRALDLIDEELNKKINELIDKIAASAWPIVFLPKEVMEKTTEKLLKYKEFLKLTEEQINELSAYIYLTDISGLLIEWHIPFEYNIEKLRYKLINIDEDTVLVQWSKSLIEQIKKTDMLKRLEEFIEGKKSPEGEKILNAIKQYLSALKID